MTITCPTCKASLTIPDDRLPKGKVVTAACPQCKGKIVIDTTEGAPPPAAAPPVSAPAPAAPAPAPDEATSYAEQAQPKALVCVADAAERDQVLATLKHEGYLAHVAKDAADALQRFKFTPYAVVILRDGFASAAGAGNPVLDYLAEMSMAIRRRMHVGFVSPAVRSGDSADAFAKSVNLVLHVNDLPHLGEALRRSQQEAEQAQRVLLESLRALGKG